MNANEKPVQWPSPIPFGKLFALLLSVFVLYWQFGVWRAHTDYLQKNLLVTYIWTEAHPDAGKYRVYYYTHEGKPYFAQLGDKGPFQKYRIAINPLMYREWLKERIYEGHSSLYVLRRPLLCFLGSLVVFLWIGSWMDRIVNRESRRGRLIRGPNIQNAGFFRRQFRNSKGLYIETK